MPPISKSPVRQERLEARVTPAQKRLIERAAQIRGTSVTDFIVSKMQEIAAETIKYYETMELRDDARELFVQSILNPGKPNKKAKIAAARYKKVIGS
jgi:uncharacterized protein (DUF1778 family)